MPVICHIPNDDLRKAEGAARAVEAAGFGGLVALDNAHGPFLPLAGAALATERIQIGTGVAIAFPRSPTIMAHAAWDGSVAVLRGSAWRKRRRAAVVSSGLSIWT